MLPGARETLFDVDRVTSNRKDCRRAPTRTLSSGVRGGTPGPGTFRLKNGGRSLDGTTYRDDGARLFAEGPCSGQTNLVY